MRRRTLQPRSPPSYIGVRMPSLARVPECDPRRRRRGYHAGKSPEDAKELHHESLQQKHAMRRDARIARSSGGGTSRSVIPLDRVY